MDQLMKSENGFWQNFSEPEKFKHVFETGHLVDCKFLVGPEEETAEIIQGHRLMFIMASPVFERMLTGEYKEAEENSVIRISDAYAHDFINFRYIIYNNHEKLSHFRVDEIIALHRLCDKYLVASIAQQCIIELKNISKNTTSDAEMLTIYKFAFKLEDPYLFMEVEALLMTRNMFHNSTLCDMSEEEFYRYILSVVPTTEALIIFSAVNEYLTQLFSLEVVSNKDSKDNLDECVISTDMMKKKITQNIIL